MGKEKEQCSFVETKPNISCQIRLWKFQPIHVLTKNVWHILKSLGERHKSVKMQKGVRGEALKRGPWPEIMKLEPKKKGRLKQNLAYNYD